MNSPARQASLHNQRLSFLGCGVLLSVILAVIITQSHAATPSNVPVESQDEVTLGLEGQPIVKSSLSSTPPSTWIEKSLPPGHRAVTINVTATTGVESWATAGTHVRVLLTYLDPKNGMNKTRVVVENAMVLSFDGKAQSPDRDMRSGSPATEISTVTLAVHFYDSLKIGTALQMGQITLALRGADDIASPGADCVLGPHNPRKKSSSRGFARITRQDGSAVEFQLDNDNRWETKSGGKGIRSH